MPPQNSLRGRLTANRKGNSRRYYEGSEYSSHLYVTYMLRIDRGASGNRPVPPQKHGFPSEVATCRGYTVIADADTRTRR
jgi:hypothetical protein